MHATDLYSNLPPQVFDVYADGTLGKPRVFVNFTHALQVWNLCVLVNLRLFLFVCSFARQSPSRNLRSVDGPGNADGLAVDKHGISALLLLTSVSSIIVYVRE